MLGTKVKPIGLSTFDSSHLTAPFLVLNTDGLDETCFYIRIVNDATTAVTISWDGTNDHEYLAPHTMWELNAQQNARPQSEMCNVNKGQKFYVAGTAGVGTITLSGYYV